MRIRYKKKIDWRFWWRRGNTDAEKALKEWGKKNNCFINFHQQE